MDSFHPLLTSLRHNEILFMAALQQTLRPIGKLFLFVTGISPSRLAYGFVAPMMTSLIRPEAGFKVFWAQSIAAWLHMIIKWVVADHRPYWWAKEYASHVNLRQGPLTCEISP